MNSGNISRHFGSRLEHPGKYPPAMSKEANFFDGWFQAYTDALLANKPELQAPYVSDQIKQTFHMSVIGLGWVHCCMPAVKPTVITREDWLNGIKGGHEKIGKHTAYVAAVDTAVATNSSGQLVFHYVEKKCDADGTVLHAHNEVVMFEKEGGKCCEMAMWGGSELTDPPDVVAVLLHWEDLDFKTVQSGVKEYHPTVQKE